MGRLPSRPSRSCATPPSTATAGSSRSASAGWRPTFRLPDVTGKAAADAQAALEALGADRIRHGIRSVEDPGLVAELAGRGIVLDVCPLSNLRTGVVRSLDEHPLPQLVAAGVRCSISTDDPAMFDTDLTRDYEAAAALGVSPRAAYEAGLAGAFCDHDTRARLQRLAESHDWDDR